MKLTKLLKDNLLLILLVLIMGGTAAYFLILHPRLRVTMAPKLISAVVVVKTNNMDYATNDRLVVTPDEDPQLQAVVIAQKHGDSEPTYFSVSKKLKIDGKMIPEDRIESWDTFKWKEVRILWFKIEPKMKYGTGMASFSYDNLEYKTQFQYNWPLTWTHKLDVTGFGNSYPRQNFGFMRYKIRAEIKVGIVKVVQRCYSPGEEEVNSQNIISNKVFGIEYAPSRDAFGYAISLFNLAYSPSIDYQAFGKDNPLALRIGVDSASYFTEAVRMAGRSDIVQGDVSSLLKHIRPVFQNVHLDEKKNIYVDGTGKPVSTDQLKKGMFFIAGQRLGMYAGEGSFEVGKFHVLTPDDRVLYAPDLPLYYEEVGHFFEHAFTIGELK